MNQRSLSVLLVDDDHDDQYFFKEALRSTDLSIKLTVAFNGTEALEKIMDQLPSLVFLDINMPGQTGKECLRVIRNNKNFNEISVVMFTTSENEEDINECFDLGANLYVTKPLSTLEQSKMLNLIFAQYLTNGLLNPSKKDFVFRLYA